MYDGDKFYNLSLGDAWPQNTHISSICVDTGEDDRLSFDKQLLHPVDVPGDGKGNCSGRIGGILKVGDDLVVGFSRQKCEF